MFLEGHFFPVGEEEGRNLLRDAVPLSFFPWRHSHRHRKRERKRERSGSYKAVLFLQYLAVKMTDVEVVLSKFRT